MMMNKASDRLYEDFDPVSDLISEEKCDTLILYLPGFKKEQLKVQLTTSHVLRISGERPTSDNKWKRFNKEFKIKPDVDTKEITAKFEGGILRIRQPKLITSAATEVPKPQTQQEAPSSQPQPERENDGFITPPHDFPGSLESEAKEEKKKAVEKDEIPSKDEEMEAKRELAEKLKLVYGSGLFKELKKPEKQKRIGVFILLLLMMTLLSLYIIKMHPSSGNVEQSILEHYDQ
ncbi:uncharacterized protein LOC141615109 [Silene latifolia]|uniref:uncharacterized protein LOC141615109 n=1 Tax=Silene latifolia TaxID=37657 RepID=UPI003D770137